MCPATFPAHDDAATRQQRLQDNNDNGNDNAADNNLMTMLPSS